MLTSLSKSHLVASTSLLNHCQYQAYATTKSLR
jgi:hypothetical protein